MNWFFFVSVFSSFLGFTERYECSWNYWQVRTSFFKKSKLVYPSNMCNKRWWSIRGSWLVIQSTKKCQPLKSFLSKSIKTVVTYTFILQTTSKIKRNKKVHWVCIYAIGWDENRERDEVQVVLAKIIFKVFLQEGSISFLFFLNSSNSKNT